MVFVYAIGMEHGNGAGTWNSGIEQGTWNSLAATYPMHFIHQSLKDISSIQKIVEDICFCLFKTIKYPFSNVNIL